MNQNATVWTDALSTLNFFDTNVKQSAIYMYMYITI